jgi:predicted small metal-binding protein
MRVLECNICGDTISAAADDELKRHVREHLRSEHDEEITDADLDEFVEGEAYEATDS